MKERRKVEEREKRRKKERGERRREWERKEERLEGGRSLYSLFFCLQGHCPIMGFTLMTSCQPNYLPKISYPNTAILAVRVSTHESCGHISIQSTAHY